MREYSEKSFCDLIESALLESKYAKSTVVPVSLVGGSIHLLLEVGLP